MGAGPFRKPSTDNTQGVVKAFRACSRRIGRIRSEGTAAGLFPQHDLTIRGGFATTAILLVPVTFEDLLATFLRFGGVVTAYHRWKDESRRTVRIEVVTDEVSIKPLLIGCG